MARSVSRENARARFRESFAISPRPRGKCKPPSRLRGVRPLKRRRILHRIFEVHRFAENVTIDRHQRIGAPAPPRPARSAQRASALRAALPDRQFPDRQPVVRNFVDRRRDDLKLIARLRRAIGGGAANRKRERNAEPRGDDGSRHGFVAGAASACRQACPSRFGIFISWKSFGTENSASLNRSCLMEMIVL